MSADSLICGADPRTLEQWLEHFGGLARQRIELGLERVHEVWIRLGAPSLGCPVITVGGTNGKGSCVAMLDAVARAGGYRTACYTSPHLLRYNERVRLDGRAVDDTALCSAFAELERARGAVALTYFEAGTLAALLLFARSSPDLVILEVGLGGRLDAVNILDADCAIVTSIGLDHTDWLGDDLDSIAVEKAGIFRAGRPAVIAQADAPASLRRDAEALGARVVQVGREVRVLIEPGGGWFWVAANGERLALPLPALRGSFQVANAAAAVAALREIAGSLPVPVAAIREGLLGVRLPGRFQVIEGEPTWIFDVAHNAQAAEALAANLRTLPRGGRLRVVLGVLADKQPEAIAAALAPVADVWYASASTDSRAMDAAMLAERIRASAIAAEVHCRARLVDALAEVRAVSSSEDRVLVCGSFTTVGEALADMGVDA